MKITTYYQFESSVKNAEKKGGWVDEIIDQVDDDFKRGLLTSIRNELYQVLEGDCPDFERELLEEARYILS